MATEDPVSEVDALRDLIDAHRPLSADLVAKLQAWLVPTYLYASGALGRRDALTRAQVTAFCEREIVSGGHPIERFLALERHRDTFEHAQRHAAADAEVTLEFVRDLHRRLVAGSRRPGARPGEWKTEASPPTRRRGREFRYAPPEDVPELMSELLAELARRREEEHPLVVIPWLHYHLHLIHPFARDNGPVLRLVSTTALMAHGYPPLVIPPDDLGAYLDALAACDNTAPESARVPLSDKLETAPLRDFFCERLRDTATRVLAKVEGDELAASEVPEASRRSQARTLVQVVEGRSDLSWRVRAGFEVRHLFERLQALAGALASEGALYAIALEDDDVVPTHRLAGSRIAAYLPAGDAGVIGRLTLAIRPARLATSGVRYPEPQALTAVVAAARIGLQLALHWEGERDVVVEPGPARSAEWSEAALDKLLTSALDRRRREFEQALMERNLSREEQARLVAEQRERKRTRLVQRAARRERAAHARTPFPALPRPAEEPEGAAPAAAARDRATTRILPGVGPEAPPVEF